MSNLVKITSDIALDSEEIAASIKALKGVSENSARKSTQYSNVLNDQWNLDSVTAISFDNSTYSYTIYYPEITETSIIEMMPDPNVTPDQWAAYRDAELIGGVQQAGSIVVRCMGVAPSVAIPVIFIIRGDMP